jgi:hypothetical protein
MPTDKAIITVHLIQSGRSHDLEVPLDIAASELCAALFQTYPPDRYGDMRQYSLKAERPPRCCAANAPAQRTRSDH